MPGLLLALGSSSSSSCALFLGMVPDRRLCEFMVWIRAKSFDKAFVEVEVVVGGCVVDPGLSAELFAISVRLSTA